MATPPTLPRRIDLLIGVSGCGKTCLARGLILDHDRVIIIDHRDEYSFGHIYTDFERLALDAERESHFVKIWRGDPLYFEHICHLAFAVGRVCILIEEAERFEIEEGSWYRQAILTGRMPAQISLIALTQRPQLLNPDLRSQASGVYAFRNSEPSALQWLKYYFGPATVELATLPPLHGRAWRWDAPEVIPFEVEP